MTLNRMKRNKAETSRDRENSLKREAGRKKKRAAKETPEAREIR